MIQSLSARWQFPLQPLSQGLIVSCQAPVASPLYDPQVIAAMALAVVNQGAAGVRIDHPDQIAAVRQRVQVPIIGLWKSVMPNSAVYITPQFEQAAAVARAGADVIAIDATQRPRPGGVTCAELIKQIHTHLGRPVMADVDTLEAAMAAAEAGADCVATTLFGYTADTQAQTPPGWALLDQLVATLSIPVICEGGIASPAMALRALERGAYAVVVGTDITGIDHKTQTYFTALQPQQSASGAIAPTYRLS